ncbi:hypothetical protein D3C83_04490 [compost metagenome]
MQHHIQNESGDQQENDRQHGTPHLLLIDLLREDLVRDLVLAPDGAEPAVRLQNTVQRLDRPFARCVAREPQEHGIERPLHVECSRERLSVDPEHGKPFVVRHGAAAGRVDVFRRECGADHREALELAIQQHVHTPAKGQPARIEEALVHHHFAFRTGRGPAAALQRETAHRRWAGKIEADHARDHRRHHSRKGELRIAHHPGLHLRYAGNRANLFLQRARSALRRCKDVRKARRIVVMLA